MNESINISMSLPEIIIVAIVIVVVIALYLYLRNLMKSFPTAEEYAEGILSAFKETDLLQETKHPRAVFECPYDIKKRSCPHLDCATVTLTKRCEDCDWYGNGVRPSEF